MDQVTITLLPASLSFVHIPRHRLSQLSHQIVKQIIQQDPVFLNITSNELEISIFSSSPTLLDDFVPVARRDQRLVSTGQSAQRHKKTQPIELSPERWSVLQIDSHSEQLDNSGARVHELSAPLAAAGISILFQSSYMADFIFVRESRLQEVLTILTSAGFDSYSNDSTTLISPSVSPPITPGIPSDGYEMTMSVDLGTNAVFTRSRKGSQASWSSISDKSRAHSSSTVTDSLGRLKSYSPSAGDVRVLSSDLMCVGLSDDHVDHWSLKIIKLVAYPELLSFTPKSSDELPPSPTPSSPYLSSSDDEDGYFPLPPKSDSSASSLASANSSPQSLTLKQLPEASVQELSQTAENSTQNRPTDTSPCKVPFFSFTRTPEGTSLTTDIEILTTLFPPSEREMVMGNGELDRADARLSASRSHSDADEDDISDDDGVRSTLRCLQVDLRKYGLDKFGLVNRYATVLERNGINHMYSSTFKTANLLVDKKHAERARVLLRSC